MSKLREPLIESFRFHNNKEGNGEGEREGGGISLNYICPF